MAACEGATVIKESWWPGSDRRHGRDLLHRPRVLMIASTSLLRSVVGASLRSCLREAMVSVLKGERGPKAAADALESGLVVALLALDGRFAPVAALDK